jgi:hypothetical protein
MLARSRSRHYVNGGLGVGAIAANPSFVNPNADEYHLKFGSPAMNVGSNLGAPPLDRSGIVRPLYPLPNYTSDLLHKRSFERSFVRTFIHSLFRSFAMNMSSAS